MVEIVLTNKTNVYAYITTSSGVTNIGNLIRTENVRGYTLDLFEDESIPITYAINDILDPSKKTSPYTKNFLIPGTKRNQIAMGFPFMISDPTPFQIFNGEIVNGTEWWLPIQEAQIYKDGILAFSGRMELMRALTNNGEVSSFEINFLATQLNIFDELENKKMTDLNLPSPLIANKNDVDAMFNVVNSDDTFVANGNTYSGFTLAYPDWGFMGPTSGATYLTNNITNTVGRNSIFRTTSQIPTDPSNTGLRVGFNLTQYAFVKTLVDKIFEGTDFEYSSDFFNSDIFKRALLLYYDSGAPPSNMDLKIYGENPTSSTFYDDLVNSSPGGGGLFYIDMSNIQDTGTVSGSSPFNASEGLTDTSGVWDPESQTLTFKKKGNYRITVKGTVVARYGWNQRVGGVGVKCGASDNIYPHATFPILGPLTKFAMRQQNGSNDYWKDISAIPLITQVVGTPTTYVKNSNTYYQWERSYDMYTTPLLFNINVEDGDIYKFQISPDTTKYMTAPVDTPCPLFPANEHKYQVAVDMIAVDATPVYHNWQQTLPEITQKEFLSDLIKHFNMYTEISSNSRTIVMEPRDAFYNGGIVQDWSYKMDNLSLRAITRSDPPLEVYARMRKTNNVKDIAHQNINPYQLEYGSSEYVLPNGKENSMTIQSSFASVTPYRMQLIDPISGGLRYVQNEVKYSAGVTGSYIYNVPNLGLFSSTYVAGQEVRAITNESERYICSRGAIVKPFPSGLPSTEIRAYYSIPGDPGVIDYLYGIPTGSTGASGPICDHLWSVSTMDSSETSPSIDINFSPAQLDWISGGQVPPGMAHTHGSYEEFYSSFFSNLNSQRVFTANFFLNENDINSFSFRNPIYIQLPSGDAAYFIVSKIDYDPTQPGPSKVELLTFNKEYFNFNYDSLPPGGLPPDQKPSKPIYVKTPEEPPYDADADRYFDAIATVGGSITTTEQEAITQLVIDMKAVGVWAQQLAIYPAVGNTASVQKINLKSPGTYDLFFEFGGTWSFSGAGARPTSSYAQTGIQPKLVRFDLNGISLAKYVIENIVGIGTDIGVQANGYILSLNAGIALDGSEEFNVGSGAITSFPGTPRANWVGTNKDGVSYLFKDSLMEASGPALVAYGDGVYNPEITLNARDNDIPPTYINSYTDRGYAFASVGYGLTPEAAKDYSDVIENYQIRLGRANP